MKIKDSKKPIDREHLGIAPPVIEYKGNGYCKFPTYSTITIPEGKQYSYLGYDRVINIPHIETYTEGINNKSTDVTMVSGKQYTLKVDIKTFQSALNEYYSSGTIKFKLLEG